MSAFLSGIVSGFATRTTEKNDEKRKEIRRRKELYLKETVIPNIQKYRETKTEIASNAGNLVDRINLLLSSGVPEYAVKHVYNAGLNSKGEFTYETAMEWYKLNKQYFKPAQVVEEEKSKFRSDMGFEQPQTTQPQTQVSPPVQPQRQDTNEVFNQSQDVNFTPIASQKRSSKVSVRDVLRNTFGNSTQDITPEDIEQMSLQAQRDLGVDPIAFKQYMAGQAVDLTIDNILQRAGIQTGTFDANQALPEGSAKQRANREELSQASGISPTSLAQKDAGALDIRTNPITGEQVLSNPYDRTTIPLIETKEVTLPTDAGNKTIRTEVRSPSKQDKAKADSRISTAKSGLKTAYGALSKLYKQESIGNLLSEGKRFISGVAENITGQEMFPEANDRAQLNSEIIQLGEMYAQLNQETGRRSNQDFDRAMVAIRGDNWSGKQFKTVLETITERFEEAMVTSIYESMPVYSDPEADSANDEAVIDQIARDYIREYNLSTEEDIIRAFIKAESMVEQYKPKKYGLSR